MSNGRKQPIPPPTNQVRPDPPPAPPRKRLDSNGVTVRSMRDDFAMAALPAVLNARVMAEADMDQESIAEECYELADALLEARAK